MVWLTIQLGAIVLTVSLTVDGAVYFGITPYGDPEAWRYVRTGGVVAAVIFAAFATHSLYALLESVRREALARKELNDSLARDSRRERAARFGQFFFRRRL